MTTAIPMTTAMPIHDHQHDHDHGHAPHDWHSQTYVDEWIKRDESRDDERRPRIRQMIAMAMLPHDAALNVLDVGGGYGYVTDEVLHAFPNAHVTLQDYSELMLARAREHLAKSAGQLSSSWPISRIQLGPSVSAVRST